MTDTQVQKLILKNWQNWSSGGVASDELRQAAATRILDRLGEWLSSNTSIAPSLPPKDLLDLTTWCAFGADRILLLPSNIREREIQSVCSTYHIDRESIPALVNSAVRSYT